MYAVDHENHCHAEPFDTSEHALLRFLAAYPGDFMEEVELRSS
jgi:hypothetical protein